MRACALKKDCLCNPFLNQLSTIFIYGIFRLLPKMLPNSCNTITYCRPYAISRL